MVSGPAVDIGAVMPIVLLGVVRAGDILAELHIPREKRDRRLARQAVGTF